MPTISKIRFTNVVYEAGAKRYTDSIFHFDGHNGAIVLENGGGKTVFIQTALQAVMPHVDLAGRKMKDTLALENGPAHIAVEWLLTEKPRRRYVVTCISLFMDTNGMSSYRYVHEYGEGDEHRIEQIPFTKTQGDRERVSDKGEIHDYYMHMQSRYSLTSKTFFNTIDEYKKYLEEQYHIISTEWAAIAKINSNEGGIEAFFDECKTTSQLVDRLLIPTIESSMEGYKQGAFVDLFQARQDSFKQYRALKEKLDTNRDILIRLQEYVEGYTRYDQQKKEYDERRRESKAAWQYLEGMKQVTVAELLQLDMQKEELQAQEKLMEKQADSLKIAQAKETLEALETVYYEVQDEYEALQDRIGSEEQQYYSIRYAQIRERQKEAAFRLEYIHNQMEQLEQSADEQELQVQWDQNGRHLRAFYMQEEQKLKANLEDMEEQRKGLEQQRNECAKSENMEDQAREQLGIEESRIVTQYDSHKSRATDISRQILSNVQTQSVEREMSLWKEEYTVLQREIVAFVQVFHKMERKKERLQQLQADGRVQLAAVREELGKVQAQLTAFDQEHAQMLQELSVLHPAWSRVTSLHTQADSIRNRLTSGIVHKERQKQDLLYKERIAYRYVDDYQQQDVFFADPYAAELVHHWSNEFSMLQLGVQYVEQSEQAGEHPLWEVTLLTTVHEKEKLLKKLRQSASKLQYPIRVLSTEEAKRLLTPVGEPTLGESWVEPGLWMDVQDSAQFQIWKQAAEERAELARQEREDQENKLEQWRDVLRQTERFFDRYRIESIHELRQLLEGLGDRRNILQKRLDLWDGEMKHLDQHKDELQQKKRLQEQQTAELERRLNLGHEWLAIMQKNHELEHEMVSVREQINLKRKHVDKFRQQKISLDTQCRDAEKQIIALEGKLLHMQEDELYTEVQVYSPLENSFGLQRLRDEYENLKMRRRQMMMSRTELEGKQQSLIREKSQAEQEMSVLRKEHSNIILELDLPPHEETRMEEIWKKCEELKERVHKIRAELDRRRQERDLQGGVVKQLLSRYTLDHEDESPISFHGSLRQVHERIEQTQRELSLQLREVDKVMKSTLEQRRKFEQALNQWNQVIKLYQLDDPQLQSAQLTEEQRSEWLYQAFKHSETAIKELEQRAKQRDQEKTGVEAHKQRFLDFCNKSIQDPKQREMAKSGIRKNDTLEELLDFESLLRQSIVKTNQIAELHLQTEDQKLQHYITHIHMHIKQIVQELRDLPKKTRVRTENGSKEIYVFKIPEWDEAEGKQRIHAHIDWIVEQLDRTPYQAEHNENSVARVRKDLEKWLDSKQLLQKVLKHETINISCHKVTNDQQITSAKFSWETSNSWSGGERWSKNMTLFLGLLNYVAERKQHIQGQMKRHRVVILDNPFGKASSDHVLSPVFYIAEQLGFQIIALTAHAEGKFLQDYFPVMYSCRLRGVAGEPGKQIIDPHQKMDQAYFRDFAPESKVYIGEVKQLELFE
ncbi:chromosome segregation ATPase [Paenibacillus sp. BJ-4]|uniref:chromosome segregation ATPase n=1 Tax=Paenibacillus sp. BJ-4 TaxID=2878097 RepID=UPI001CEFBCE9|nr:chromosome segregation ATPase [Paenibacillus sp. BJ-4]